jgi:hypothetical protein
MTTGSSRWVLNFSVTQDAAGFGDMVEEFKMLAVVQTL